MTETYKEYLRRVEGLPSFTPLTEEQWKAKVKTQEVSPTQPTATPHRQRQFSSEERVHMAVLAEEALQRDKLREHPLPENPVIGLTAEQNAKKVRESSEEAFRNIQASEAEDRKASEERQRKLEKELADAEHMREIAAKALESDRIRQKALGKV